jgi:hypothetical protein
MDNANVYIYPHLHFYIGYNEDQIVAIQISTDVRDTHLFCFERDGKEKLQRLSLTHLLVPSLPFSYSYHAKLI